MTLGFYHHYLRNWFQTNADPAQYLIFQVGALLCGGVCLRVYDVATRVVGEGFECAARLVFPQAEAMYHKPYEVMQQFATFMALPPFTIGNPANLCN